MEFLLIGESKLKVVLSDVEMREYNLDPCIDTGGGAGVRRAFWKILDKAKDKVGFDPAGDKVLIQFYPVSSGGCEIFVTKLGILPESSARLISKSNKIEVLSRNEGVYVFNSLDDLIALCRVIREKVGDNRLKSDVYFLGGEYYLSILEYGKGGETTEFPCILEFASGLTADFSLYIREHADRLTNGDGIEKFSLV